MKNHEIISSINEIKAKTFGLLLFSLTMILWLIIWGSRYHAFVVDIIVTKRINHQIGLAVLISFLYVAIPVLFSGLLIYYICKIKK